ncbi:MAG TPA: transglycosylase domain-containing protein, partial [Xanthobacteraceae bacterium]
MRFATAILATVLVSAVFAAAWWVHALGPLPLASAIDYSTLVVDREGRLLRPYATADGRWRLPVKLAEVDPRYVEALIAYEDKRFREHRGVDPWALGRAALQFVTHGRIVSGGSTLTMQV